VTDPTVRRAFLDLAWPTRFLKRRAWRVADLSRAFYPINLPVAM
jgi:hypothetical protein